MSEKEKIDMRTTKPSKYFKSLTFKLSKDHIEKIEKAVAEGPFETMSEVLRYCISKAFKENEESGYYNKSVERE